MAVLMMQQHAERRRRSLPPAHDAVAVNGAGQLHAVGGPGVEGHLRRRAMIGHRHRAAAFALLRVDDVLRAALKQRSESDGEKEIVGARRRGLGIRNDVGSWLLAVGREVLPRPTANRQRSTANCQLPTCTLLSFFGSLSFGSEN